MASVPWIACAGICWLLAGLVTPGWMGLAVTGIVAIVSVRLGYPWIAVAVTAVIASMSLGPASLQPLEPGMVTVEGTLATEIVEGRFGPWALLSTGQGAVLLDLSDAIGAGRGDAIRVVGTTSGKPGTVRGKTHRGVVRVDELEVLDTRSSPVVVAGNLLRARVIERLQPPTPGRALLAGFLIGDTSGVDEIDVVAMRKAGLSHFTAVSGSNVVLFLGLLFIAAGPLGLEPKRRAIVGLIGLPIYAAATAFEPSVLRASLMAGTALAGRLAGIVFEAWQLLSLAVIVLLIADSGLTSSVGLQLSVAATMGVLIGARWPVGARLARRALAVTVGAQLAVAPLLLLHFGQVPVVSPLVNLIAAPLVATATMVGAIGVVGPSSLVGLGAWLADLVLILARSVVGWPQLSLLGVLGVGGAGLLFIRYQRLRGAITLGAAALLVVVMTGVGGGLPSVGAVVLDVGQGDSILLVGGEGHFALVDGGPDPVLLIERLGQYGIRTLDLVVLTHVHADHAAGLTGVVGRIPIGRVWAAVEPHETPVATELLTLLAGHGIATETPEVGQTWLLGQLELTVLGPRRRYASPNDQSIVLLVRGSGRSMLLSGDIERVAQWELDGVTADVLKVPHQGGATSDPAWLEQVGADLAVISVGPNDFGHPADWVLELLEQSGTEVLRTDIEGDVVVPLG